uniref:NADH-ubiquinone oxidoreductase chain 6 n=1 Tax=Cephalopina titillator TaxID=2707115 RepID=A0A6C0U8L3_9MUSC|nr:NADH dehydrogenase subunit 6 [Cephalopina titillator]QIB71456.1 NADH dehydrogenase subunit 6 [Cephalopina titillator]
MIQWILMTLSITLSLIFIKSKHPLAMGLTLLIQTTSITLMTGAMTQSFWYSYILFLIFLGGMLVLFIYVTSLASNEMFSMKKNLTMMYLLLLLTSSLLLMIMDNNKLLNYHNLETKLMDHTNMFMEENSLSLNKLYNYPSNLMTILLMNYLLITLIAIVKITDFSKGPLRPMFNN